MKPEELAEKLTLLGMEVSSIERIGADWQRIVVGELLEVAPHPGSGRLWLTRVRTGDGEPEALQAFRARERGRLATVGTQWGVEAAEAFHLIVDQL